MVKFQMKKEIHDFIEVDNIMEIPEGFFSYQVSASPLENSRL